MSGTVADYLSKAGESLASAESDFAAGRYNSCANRAYYACFQAAIAALIHASIASPSQRVWNHGYVQAEFNGQLVNRRKIYPSRLRATLGRNRDTRDRANYSGENVSRTQAQRAVSRARDFVPPFRELWRSNMTETARIDRGMASAIEELKAIIRSYDSNAQFEIAAGPDASDTYLIARVDTEDADEVMDLYIDRLVEMQVEDRLPLYVMTLRATNELPNNRASRGARPKPRGK